MNWHEFKTKTREQVTVTREKEASFDADKKEFLPVIQKEASTGSKGIERLSFQEVLAHGFYKGEFGVKGEDLIFHFWPDGYHEAQSKQLRPPNFQPGFEAVLKKAVYGSFNKNSVLVELDADVGAFFVKVTGGAINQFHRKMCIKVCEELYTLLGGKTES